MSANRAEKTGELIRPETAKDKAAIEALIAVSFGERRHQRSVRYLRQCQPLAALCFVIEKDNQLVGSVRFWPILVAGKVQLLLGPLGVHPDHKNKGYGKALVAHSLHIAQDLPHDFVLISGEPDYYPRFGFVPATAEQFLWPGFLEPERLQIKWLKTAPPARHDDSPQAILPMLS